MMELRNEGPSEDEGAKLVGRVRGILGGLETKEMKSSIHKVPHKLARLNEDAYRPQLASIGPYHYMKQDLQGMEEQKWRYMGDLFLRLPRTWPSEDAAPATLSQVKALAAGRSDKLTRKILEWDEEVRKSYSDSEALDRVKPGELAMMMLADACFIIELFLRSAKNDDDDDPIFNNAWKIRCLQHDLLLLENQIPFFIIDAIFAEIDPPDIYINVPAGGNSNDPMSLNDLAFYFFFKQKAPPQGQTTTPKHLLHLLHQLFLPRSQESITLDHSWGFSHGAARLEEQGIWFTAKEASQERNHRNENANNIAIGANDQERAVDVEAGAPLIECRGPPPPDTTGTTLDLNVEFDGDGGGLKVPLLLVNHTTEPLFRNLIAFEQCDLRLKQHVTSYAFMLRSLAESNRDVSLLASSGIIAFEGRGGGAKVRVEEYVPALFRGLCEEVVPKAFWFADTCNEANKFRPKSWWQFRRSFTMGFAFCGRKASEVKQSHFKGPWSGAGFLAGFLISALTSVQTYVQIVRFYREFVNQKVPPPHQYSI